MHPFHRKLCLIIKREKNFLKFNGFPFIDALMLPHTEHVSMYLTSKWFGISIPCTFCDPEGYHHNYIYNMENSDGR